LFLGARVTLRASEIDAMTLDDNTFAELVQQAIAMLPEQFRIHMEHLVVDVEDVPDAGTAARLGVHPAHLLGLYHGRPLTRRSVEEVISLPARIVLYKRNIERLCDSPDQIVQQIRRTLLHEIGHHFGMSEQDLRRLGYG